MANESLSAAKLAKNDEFYTQYADIESELNAYISYNPEVFKDKTILLPCDDPEWSNFTKYFAQKFESLGLKKLISTSLAAESKPEEIFYQPSLFEKDSPKFDEKKTRKNGKIFTLTKDNTGDGIVNFHDLEWDYLEGDGDFRSLEITKLRDEADIIITNPPFSLFREFLAWIMDGEKNFSIIGNMNAITYREVFPLIMENKIWLGVSSGSKTYLKPDGTEHKMGNTCWFSNLEHGKRHEPLSLMTMEDNLRFNKTIEKTGYKKYDNYEAIEVPKVVAIPNNFDGIMGVPISFLDKYNPDQFEILGATQRGCHDLVPDTKKYDSYWEVRQDGTKTGSSGNKTNENANLEMNDGKKNYFINNEGHVIQSAYQRIFIRHKK